MSHHGVATRSVMRSVAFLCAGALAMSVLAGCSDPDPAGKPLAGQDIAPAARAQIADGGTLRWAVDAVPETLNTFQSDADATTTRIAQATLPSMFRSDRNGRPERNPSYLESAKTVETEPKQVVLYKLNQQAVWSDGREIGAADFAAQWRALSGKDSAYWTARNAGYDRIEKIERGDNDLEVRVTFGRPYADWRSLFSPLYPKEVMGTPDAFNDGARGKLKVSAGPFVVRKIDRKDDEVRLTRNPRWWGEPAKLNEIVLRAVPRDERAAELAAGELDLAEVDPTAARRIALAAPRPKAATASASGTPLMGPPPRALTAKQRRDQARFRGFEVRKSLEPAYTQLALNGGDGPLADERVRRGVARALDREKLAKLVLSPLGLPAEPVGSHLALSGQAAYADSSGAIGGQDTAEAQALLTDAGWVPGGRSAARSSRGTARSTISFSLAGSPHQRGLRVSRTSSSLRSIFRTTKGPAKESGKESEEKSDKKSDKKDAGKDSEGGDDGTYVVGEDNKGEDESRAEEQGKHLAQDGKQYGSKQLQQGGAPGAYAPRGTAAPAGAAVRPLAKDGKALTLRFVVPTGEGSHALRTVADRIAIMLERVGIRTVISKVADESYFKDHIASGQYDLALYSWPTSAYPATDARPIYAKPVPAADGSLNVEQNYTRVGTDQVDQLFDQAVATLDESESRSLIRKADSRIWAAAGSIPLYQRPQLTAARTNVANAGAFGFGTPVFEDMGFLKKGANPGPEAS
ncbi:ABC transporter family substrate-binding protein [Streptomyces sp. uw30]|uniref:ABC transporter family substrate-binding protein n=1 Tax=Streptomyces sp. uw30 TaxID=1828179 RepID=UPI0016514FE0|nr:ABC transporter family substrate-binding protein [Streptomyces sp. uw30]